MTVAGVDGVFFMRLVRLFILSMLLMTLGELRAAFGASPIALYSLASIAFAFLIIQLVGPALSLLRRKSRTAEPAFVAPIGAQPASNEASGK
jgi:hypothetical protein